MMNYTQAQLLKLTGMTLDRLRHWRKELPGLSERLGRKAAIPFEEIVLLTVLSRGVDLLGISIASFAQSYPDLLAAFHDLHDMTDPSAAIWITNLEVALGDHTHAPDCEAAVMIRISPAVLRLQDELGLVPSPQLKLNFS